jgi:hypothetical protein
MNRKESLYFVIGIAVTALLLTLVLNERGIWMSMAQTSTIPTATHTKTPAAPTPTYTPVPPTPTYTPVPPTPTNTPVAPTPTYTPEPPTPTPVPPTPTPTNTPASRSPTKGVSVTGSGRINSPVGAYVEDASVTGKATFGFDIEYKTGDPVPTGKAKFKLKGANLSFRMNAYEQLVVDGYRASLVGTGRINRAGSYGFLIAAVDAELAPGIDVDLFRIKIWDRSDGDAVVYDSQIGCADVSDDALPCRAVAGRGIAIGK